MSEFLFVRHGQSQANEDNTIAGPPSPLTQEGMEQAKEAGQNLIRESITAIVCSPLLRAMQTAEIIAHEIGIDPETIRVIDTLRERDYGAFIDQPKVHHTQWYTTKDLPSVESVADLFKRMSLCLDTIKQEAQSERLLVVGHFISGFYLVQIAHHKSSPDLFDTIPEIHNAEVVRVPLQ
jgi:broad specificity phosphatase PhoE